MTANASAIASDNGKALQLDRKYALVALHAARHMSCTAHSRLRALLVDLLMQDGHTPEDASQHADDLIDIACAVLVSIDAGEPRKMPWPGGENAAEYAKAIHELEISK